MAIFYRPRSGVQLSYPGFEQPGATPQRLSPLGLILAPSAAAGVAMGITLLYRAMAYIMETEGGFVASGGPYEIAHPAPTWVGLVPLSVFGMIIFGGIGVAIGKRGWGESPLLYGWIGLFTALGWNFLRLGFNPPENLVGAWAWIMCGVVFWIMGLAPAGLIVSWAIDAFKDARAHRPPATVAGRPTRGIYLAMQVAGVAAGIIGANALFASVTAV